VKSSKENITAWKSVLAGAGIGTLAICAGCSSDKVLTDRPFIPAPSDQIGATTMALPPLDLTIIAPPPFPEYKAESLSYTVKRGDSFWKIARIYGVSMQELAAANDMDIKRTLKVGETLKVPAGGALIPEDKLPPLPGKKSSSKTSSAGKTVSSEPLPRDGVYSVKNGDSLWKIAKKFNVPVTSIANANGIDSKSALQVGQKLKIPSGEVSTIASTPAEASETKTTFEEIITTAPTMETETDILSELDVKAAEKTTASFSDPSGFSHDVKDGETWDYVANFYGIKVEALKKANPSANTSGQPAAGTKLNIPADL
jgi:LysM repeat protein